VPASHHPPRARSLLGAARRGAGGGAMEPRLRALYRDAGGRALATLLEVGGCAVLLDCGWAAAAPAPGAGAGAPAEAAGLDPALLAPLAAVAPRLDCVLVSHADLAHLGALPYAVGRLGVTCPILGTLPCSNMGQMCMYDDFLSRQGAEDFDTYNLDDVDRAFSRFETLQFNQRRVLDPGREGASKSAPPPSTPPSRTSFPPPFSSCQVPFPSRLKVARGLTGLSTGSLSRRTWLGTASVAPCGASASGART